MRNLKKNFVLKNTKKQPVIKLQTDFCEKTYKNNSK